MKKYIFTESQIKKIVDTELNEQEERKFIMRVQKFLNEIFKNDKTFKQLTIDGKTGPNSQTESAIMKLQSMIKVYPTDGVWGPETEEAMKNNNKVFYNIWETKYKPGFFSDWF